MTNSFSDNLIGDDYNADFLFEHRRKVKLTRKLIFSSEKQIENKHIEDRYSCDGISYLFAKTIIDYSKAAYDNIMLGHFDAANMILRSMIENKVFLEIIYNDESDELWKYYYVHSYRNSIMKNMDIPRQKDIDFLEYLYQDLKIEENFYKAINKKRPPINKKYGWLYKKGNFPTFESICKLVEFDEYSMYKLLCENSHGTSLVTKLFSNTFIEHITLIFQNIYLILYNTVITFCDYNFDEEFDEITTELENIYLDFIDECEKIYGE